MTKTLNITRCSCSFTEADDNLIRNYAFTHNIMTFLSEYYLRVIIVSAPDLLHIFTGVREEINPFNQKFDLLNSMCTTCLYHEIYLCCYQIV